MKNKNKYFKIIGSTIIAMAFLLIAFGSGEEKSEMKCDTSVAGYNSGYEAGKTSVWDDSYTHISECNNGNGMIGEVPPCWHEGFKDGHDSK
jgi:hypothetical protein